MALSWTQDRIGPICRAVEDCALVMSVIARPDGRDLSVADIPFNWDAGLDPRSLKVGYLEDAFADADRNPEWAQATTRRRSRGSKALGFDLVPQRGARVPDRRVAPQRRIGCISRSPAALWPLREDDEQVPRRTDAQRALIPAVEYLQSQRMRALMMQELANATAAVDVYVTPSTHGSPRREGERDSSNAPRAARRSVTARWRTSRAIPPSRCRAAFSRTALRRA